MPLHIRKHPPDGLNIRGINLTGQTQASFPLGGLFGQNMAGKSFPTHNFPRTSNFEPLGGSPIRFHFRHNSTPLNNTSASQNRKLALIDVYYKKTNKPQDDLIIYSF
jgi:hypothetical protein